MALWFRHAVRTLESMFCVIVNTRTRDLYGWGRIGAHFASVGFEDEAAPGLYSSQASFRTNPRLRGRSPAFSVGGGKFLEESSNFKIRFS